MTLPSVSAVVLAGGRSSRFGRDKLAEPLGAGSLLDRAIDAVSPLASEVLVVVAPGAQPPLTFAGPGTRIVRDPVAFGGPGIGLRAALETAREPLALVVAGDMPRLSRPVLELLVRSLVTGEADVEAVALSHRGRRRPLPMALRVGSATTAAQHAAADNDASLLGILRHLRVHELDEQEWRPLDPMGLTLTDVDRPRDLAGLD